MIEYLESAAGRVFFLGVDADVRGGNDIWEGWGSVALVVGSTLVVLLIVGALLWQLIKTLQTRMTTQAEIARDGAFRRLAEESTATQRQFIEQQESVVSDMSDVKARLAAIEKLLREVD
ncbi:MAG: hypothetical protein GEU28_09295 [Dehalococcoidia bacterium]|nr:hypothetical protein [Dehalococcoidia bacterium]